VQRIPSPAGATISYEQYGSGPPLVLVHGGFSNHHTNWEGAQVALAATSEAPDHVRRLVLYESPWPSAIGSEALARLEALGEPRTGRGSRCRSSATCCRSRFTSWTRCGRARCGLRLSPTPRRRWGTCALNRYDFRADRFRKLRLPVVLQIGTESPRHLYVTDALAAVLTDVRIQELAGQAHEGMTTAPELYAEAVSRVLLSQSPTMRWSQPRRRRRSSIETVSRESR
jgi:pimeloyl-ACP methyl ester carboxylesterase